MSLLTSDLKTGTKIRVLYYFLSKGGAAVNPGDYEVLGVHPAPYTGAMIAPLLSAGLFDVELDDISRNCIILDPATPSIRTQTGAISGKAWQNAVNPTPNTQQTSSWHIEEGDPMLPEGNDPIVPRCVHTYQVYTGLNETFEYCTQCGLKRDDIKKQIEDTIEEQKTPWYGRIS